MSKQFQGKRVLVTGAARGQGFAMAEAFAKAGADVAICDIAEQRLSTVDYPLASADQLEKAAEALTAYGGKVVAKPCDIRNQGQVNGFVRAAVEVFGGLDVVVNNAGILSGNEPVHAMDEERFVTMIDINLTGQWRVLRSTVPHLIEGGGGAVINIASAAGLIGAPGFGHYCAAKHGLVGLTKTMAAELAPYRITVNAVCPGLVDTTMVSHSAEDLAAKMQISEDEAYEQFLLTHHIKDRIQPTQTAAAVLYFASEAARVVTGACLPVDGGWTAT